MVKPDSLPRRVAGTGMRAEEGNGGEDGVIVRRCYRGKYTGISLDVGWHQDKVQYRGGAR